MQTTTTSDPSKDVFQDSVTQLAKTANKQRKLVFVGGAIVIAVMIAVGLYLSKRNAKMNEGRAAFFEARTTLESELNTVRESLPKPPAPAAAKGTPPAPAPQASLEFERFAVAEKLPKSIAALENVGQSYSGVLPGFEAYMLLGQTFLEHGATPEERARAATYFTRAAESAPNTDRAAAAYYGLAFAQESDGKHAEAAKTFERVLNYGNTLFQADAMRGLARSQELQNDLSTARATYERIVSTFPGTETARLAQMKLADLPGGAAPAAPSAETSEKK